ncbi:RHS repeat-associated core domain-containing protein [Chryseobacterium sp. MFBS3-17]|uniref:RHS repeat-associated core domain-containing protein n=1 Tax=Chryseobacterium sp. MFBS3-17 TaxID=2886689 RepID=UPI00293F0571|nr:RHS repeat-associated core domain-containing protein [Chryseobacterium sp. MFBS3-17]
MAEQIDNLSYTYTGNRLNTVTDASANYQGYPDTSGIPMTYDANGNMTQHEDKGILNISYNFLNLPTHLIFNDFVMRGGGDSGGRSYGVNKTTDYTYRADGTKLQKKHLFFTGQLQGYDTIETTDYLDGFQYSHTTGGDPGSIFPQGLQFVPTAEGYYNFENNTYIYQYKDHLGNVRITYYSGNGGAEIIKDNQYYPFGLSHYVNESGYAGNRSYQYQYNSKEYQSDSGMYDYGARFYMPDIGRWGVVDPLAEIYRRHSPYNYVVNNPIRFIDPDGRGVADIRINGGASDKALAELQKSAGTDITLSRDATTGNVTYTQNTTGALSGNASEVAKIINDHSVLVNVAAENTLTTSSGATHNGGAFLGNSLDSSTGIVTAEQAINPEILGRMGDFASKPGEGVLHEVSEAYEGSLISRTESNFVGPATQSDALDPTSVYSRAHNAAVKQPGGSLEIYYMTNDGLIFKNPTGLTTGTSGTNVQKAQFMSSGRIIFTKYPDGTFTPY